jgi:hypothetical protein
MSLIKSCFNNNSPDARLLARYLSVILWAIGSFYMISVELNKPSRDWLVIISMPIIWGIVMILPVLVYEAWKVSRYLSLVSLLIASVIGSLFTLSGTISRQSSTRDNAVKISSDDEIKRTKLIDLIQKSELMLSNQTKVKAVKCVNSKYDCSPIDDTISFIQSSLENHQKQLKILGSPQSPVAGEKRIAQLISDIFGYDLHISSKFVADYIPSMFGIFLEVAAFALTVYGWHGLRMAPVHISSNLNKQTARIEFLEHQLLISDDSLDRRIIGKQLSVAKNDLIEILNKRE